MVAGGTYYLDVGIFRTYLLEERLKVLGIFRTPLLVADADKFQVEGSGMTHVGTHFAPFGVGGVLANSIRSSTSSM